MALIKQIETKEGAVASYWRIKPRVTIDLISKKVNFIVECYLNADARHDNKQPVDSKSYSAVIDEVGGDIRAKLYALLPTLTNGTEAGFAPNAEVTPFFADAVSDE